MCWLRAASRARSRAARWSRLHARASTRATFLVHSRSSRSNCAPSRPALDVKPGHVMTPARNAALCSRNDESPDDLATRGEYEALQDGLRGRGLLFQKQQAYQKLFMSQGQDDSTLRQSDNLHTTPCG